MTPSELLALIESGESETLEFKRSVPEAHQIAQTMSAFANGRGGTLLLGVADDGSILGVDADRAEHWVMRAAAMLQPSTDVSTTRMYVDQVEVVIVDIAPSRSLTLAPNGLFIRDSAAQERPLKAAEIVARSASGGTADGQHDLETLAEATERLTAQLEKQEPLIESLQKANHPARKGLWALVGAACGAVAKQAVELASSFIG